MSNKTNLILSEIIHKCWMDKDFENKFKKNPAEIFSEYGIKISNSVEKINILENTETTVHFVLPKRPDSISIDAVDLEDFSSKLFEEQLVFPTILD